ncbi:MAG: response regulator, partial [Acidobacteria bacterium]|nr:response regulator [Acidobacteriota bacterium]
MAHLLIVDDEKSICELLEITFRKEGHRADISTSVEAARKRLQSQIYDMVISDIRMPDSSGVELLKFSKEVSPETIFILVTGLPTIETAIEAVNHGADRYVIKGDKLTEELRRVVRQVAEELKWKKEAGILRRELRKLTGLD